MSSVLGISNIIIMREAKGKERQEGRKEKRDKEIKGQQLGNHLQRFYSHPFLQNHISL